MSVLGRPISAGSTVFLTMVIIAVLVMTVTSLRAEANFQGSAPLPLTVTTIEARYESDARIEELFPGLVAARRDSALGFERGGRIESISVDVGDRVETGQVLAHLDTRALAAQIAAADAQTAEAAAQTALARGTENRQAQLLDRGHISHQRFDEIRTTTQAALARQNAAAAAADALRVQLDLSVITAPFSGVVTVRLADEGAIAPPGQTLLEIIESDALEVRVGLPPELASSLTPSEVYRFRSGSSFFQASLRSSTGVVDRQTRAVTVLFDIPEGVSISAGQVVRLAVETPIATGGFWVPVSALVEGRRGLWSVYVVEPAGQAYVLESRMVETIRIEAERVFVRGAVSQGELILATGLQRVTPGQSVIPVGAEALVQ